MIRMFSHRLWKQSPEQLPMGRRSLRPAQLVRAGMRIVPPHLLVILSMCSVQSGAALSKSLYPVIGSTGTVFLRLAFGALMLLLIWRPRVRGYTFKEYLLVFLFGLSLAGLTGFFYASIARLPLGIALTIEFVGPLGVALVASRRLPDILWTLFAVAGIVLLAPINGAAIDLPGVVLALLAGGCWAAYILLNKQVGRVFPGGTGLALGMAVAALVLAPLGLQSIKEAWHDPSIFLSGLGVAIISSVIPFSLELEALRRLSARVFGVLLSLEPVVGAL
ncbi:MAG TPA: EamA family transporter, partial [Ktedonobacteraceae bacterium]|nr:EamA family transporter [Ktedonobacteraceae bacterium]